jgi:hypothetical protein
MLGVMIRSNMYDQLFEVYKEQGLFGTSAFYVDEDEEEVIHTKALTIGQYAIGVDAKRRVNRFSRAIAYTARQLAETFGEENLPVSVKMRLNEEGDRTQYEVRHLIEPNTDYIPGVMGQRGMRFRSLHWLSGETEKPFLKIGGYHEFPVMVSRWRVIGEDIYGSEQPGDIGLDDAATIQDIEVDSRGALQRSVNPPMMAPDTMFTGGARLNNNPGGVTRYSPQAFKDLTHPGIFPLFNLQFDHPSAEMKIERLRIGLEKAFFVDLFRMWASDPRRNMTATEVEAREQEKMYILGPVVERQMSELLDPLVIRVFSIMQRRNLLPEMPEELRGQPMKIEYMSTLAKLQKQAAFSGIQHTLMMAQQLAEMQVGAGERPEILDKVDADTVLDLVQEMNAIPAGIILGKDKVTGIREEKALRMQQQQAAQAAMQASQAAPQLAGAAKDLSETQMNGSDMLSAMMNGGGQLA